MEEQNVQVEEGIRLSDIFRLLLSKIKYLILALVVGGILGGSFAVWRTYDVNYYGTSVEFYVNPEKPEDSVTSEGSQYGVYGAYGRHVMDNMIRLLKSDSFIEQMMLEGQPLPSRDGWATAEEDAKYGYTAAIDKAINVNITEKVKALNEAKADLSDARKTLTEITYTLNKEWKDIDSLAGDTFNEAIYEANVKNSDDVKYIALKQAYSAYVNAEDEYKRYDEAHTAAQAKKDEADVVVNAALEKWSMTAKYKAELAKYKGALSFSYLQNDEDFEDANNLARSFIYVKISVLNDKKWAEDLLDKVKVIVPTYVEQKMTVPDGYEGTNCQRITRTDDIDLTNRHYTTKQAIKYALLVGAAAFLVVCVIVILIDRSDKRLRDTSIITKQFNVPLLGIVPSIEELRADLATKKKTNDNTKEVK